MELRAGPRRAPQCCGLQAEEDFAGHDSVGELDLGLVQEVRVEGVRGLPLFHRSVNAALDALDVLDKFVLLRVQGGPGFVDRIRHGLRVFGFGHSVFVLTDVSFTAVRGTPPNCNQINTEYLFDNTFFLFLFGYLNTLALTHAHPHTHTRSHTPRHYTTIYIIIYYFIIILCSIIILLKQKTPCIATEGLVTNVFLDKQIGFRFRVRLCRLGFQA
jgi:hypothetical protein